MNIFGSDKDICAHMHVEEGGGVITFSFVPNVFWDFYTTIQDHNDIVIENLKRLFKTGPLIYLSSLLGKASKNVRLPWTHSTPLNDDKDATNVNATDEDATDEDARDEDATDEDETDEDATDEEATEEDATDEYATDEVHQPPVHHPQLRITPGCASPPDAHHPWMHWRFTGYDMMHRGQVSDLYWRFYGGRINGDKTWQPTTTDRVNIEQSASGRWAGRVLQYFVDDYIDADAD